MSCYPYVKNERPFRCPVEDNEKLPSYGMNGALDQRTLASIESVDHVVLLIDSKPGGNRVVGMRDFPFTERHGKYLVTGFARGRVKSVHADEVLKLDWNAPTAKQRNR